MAFVTLGQRLASIPEADEGEVSSLLFSLPPPSRASLRSAHQRRGRRDHTFSLTMSAVTRVSQFSTVGLLFTEGHKL